MQRAFDRYDTELASALGIARVEPTQAYDIENVLSQDWWDDGAWEGLLGPFEAKQSPKDKEQVSRGHEASGEPMRAKRTLSMLLRYNIVAERETADRAASRARRRLSLNAGDAVRKRKGTFEGHSRR